jgi:pseudouridine synthase
MMALQSTASSRAIRLFRWRLLDSSKGIAGANLKLPASLSSLLFSIDARTIMSESRNTLPPAAQLLVNQDDAESSAPKAAGVRLSKLLSSNLLVSTTSRKVAPWSRREAERLIQGGHVAIGGKVVTRPHHLVNLADFAAAEGPGGVKQIPPRTSDGLTVKVQGKPLSVTETDFVAMLPASSTSRSTTGPATSSNTSVPRVWIAHKLAGELVTERDPHDRPSLLERLMRGGVGKAQSNNTQRRRVHLKPIGRLDMATEGLMLLTDDGRYARDMELPVNLLRRTYRVRVHGPTDLDRVQKAMQRGITVEGIRYAPMQVRVDPSSRFGATNRWLEVTCCQGKNRQIRKVFSHFGCTYKFERNGGWLNSLYETGTVTRVLVRSHPSISLLILLLVNVTRLIRVSFGDYKLDTIPPGMAIEVPYKPIEGQRRKGSLALLPRRPDKKKDAGGR